MESAAFLDAIAREGEALAVAASGAGAGAPVPPCPGWDVADLVWHTGEVLWFWADVVEHGWDDPSPYQEPERPGDEGALLDWYRSAVARAHRVLTDVDPTTPVWSWATEDATAAWVIRRVAQELAVHRWDAESATAGGSNTIDAELASDGIDEFLDFFTGRPHADAAPLQGTVHVHCTDVDGEWLIDEPTPGDGPLHFTREHAKGDVAVRGPASDLLLVLWRRRPLEGLDVIGDEAVAARLVRRAKLD
jgi:uncharacterized protein (TIGR03083 family)